jgi:hypothetical protein
MIDPVVLVSQRPEFSNLSRSLIQNYIDLCSNNYSYKDEILIFAVCHFLEIERSGTDRVIERSGDRDAIKFQLLEVKSFWDITHYGRMFENLANRGRSFKHIRP